MLARTFTLATVAIAVGAHSQSLSSSATATTTATSTSSSSTAAAAPNSTSTATSPSPTDILQYALTLEHLESAFYTGGLAKFNASDFATGGEQRALFEQIAEHEAIHVKTLESILGDKATKPCDYNFPYTDVAGFKAMAQLLEGVGTSAYLGAAKFLTGTPLLTAAGSILAVEARHSSWLASTNGANPWPGAFDTPLSLDEVYSLAASFITSCPSTNPALPFKAFPALTLQGTNGNLKPGQQITFTLPSTVNITSGERLYVALLTGITVEYTPYSVNQSITIPGNVNATGMIFAVVTNSNASVTDESTIAGPAPLMFNPGFTSALVKGANAAVGLSPARVLEGVVAFLFSVYVFA